MADMNDPKILEEVAEAVHESWMKAKRAAGVTSRKLDTSGEELMVPYADLTEEAKELDRMTVRATLEALSKLGYRVEKS